MTFNNNVVIAFDFGHRRIGCAVGQNITSTASPLGTIKNSEKGPDWQKIKMWLDEWKPAKIIVGLPNHADGSKSDMSIDVDKFISELLIFNIPIETIDERYTSIEAKEILKNDRQMGVKKRIRKEMIDATAATLIAKRWLNKKS